MSRKKKLCLIIGIIIAAIMIAATTGYFLLRSKLVLKEQITRILNENYSYTLEYQVEGQDMVLFSGDSEGTVTGTKGSEILYGALSTENVSMMDIYVDADQNVIFNAKPIAEKALNDFKNIPIIGNLTNLVTVDDFYFSVRQIEEITGEKWISLPDAGVSENLFQSIGKDRSQATAAYSLKERKDLSEDEKLLGDDAYYFEMILEDYDSTLIIGVPKDTARNGLSLQVYYGDVTWKLRGTYNLTEDVVTVMPEETFGDEEIENLKTLYSYWKELKDAGNM